MAQITATNRKSLTQFIAEKGAVDIVKNPNTGKFFFVCGTTIGYISPKALVAIREGCDSSDLQYAEVSVDGNTPVPTLMIKATNNVVRTFTA